MAGGRLGFSAYCLIRASSSLKGSGEIGQFILNWKTKSIFEYGGQANSEINI